MSWIEVAFELKGSEVESATSTLENLNALAITLLDAKDTPIFEPPPFAEPIFWDDSILVGLFESSADVTHIKNTIQTEFPKAGIFIKNVEDQNWVALCQAKFPIQQYGKLYVCPSWEQKPNSPDAVCLNLDPGMAFGTGTHATTSLCLTWLSETNLKGKSLIDYGCGSGILALATALLGAKPVLGVDYDEQALVSSRANQAKNNLEGSVTFQHSDKAINLKADILIANILAGPLMSFKERFFDLLKEKGILVLSGILSEQKEELIQHYVSHFHLVESSEKEGWCCLEFTKGLA